MGQKERERQIGNSDPRLMPRVPSCKHDSSMCKSFSLSPCLSLLRFFPPFFLRPALLWQALIRSCLAYRSIGELKLLLPLGGLGRLIEACMKTS